MTLRDYYNENGGNFIITTQGESWALDDLIAEYQYEKDSMLNDDVSEYSITIMD